MKRREVTRSYSANHWYQNIDVLAPICKGGRESVLRSRSGGIYVILAIWFIYWMYSFGPCRIDRNSWHIYGHICGRICICGHIFMAVHRARFWPCIPALFHVIFCIRILPVAMFYAVEFWGYLFLRCPWINFQPGRKYSSGSAHTSVRANTVTPIVTNGSILSGKISGKKL
jgi:hypothetical protein